MFRLSALAFALFAASASAIEETRATDAAFDYDHPELWKDMEGSECANSKNSPIALKTMDCTHYANYELHVSARGIGLEPLREKLRSFPTH